MSETDDCIFCQLIEGEIPSYRVYENDDVYAFLDVNPIKRGHTLVVPKNHVERFEEMSRDDSRAVFDAVHELTGPVIEAVDEPGYNIWLNTGEEAGQEIPHAHAHIIPRSEEDGVELGRAIEERLDLSDDEFDKVASGISERANS